MLQLQCLEKLTAKIARDRTISMTWSLVAIVGIGHIFVVWESQKV